MTTNIAARLAAQAGDGDIVISEATRERLGPDLAVEDLGVRELKNVEAPMRLFRLR
jgi:class 3 adenylate cyclase